MFSAVNNKPRQESVCNKVFLLTAAAEDEESVLQRAISDHECWVTCFERAKLAGTVFTGSVTSAGENPEHPARIWRRGWEKTSEKNDVRIFERQVHRRKETGRFGLSPVILLYYDWGPCIT